MADKVEKVEKTERELRWEALVAKYEKQNPVKFAEKKAAGKFDKMPDSFV